jgi:hypothetical protein
VICAKVQRPIRPNPLIPIVTVITQPFRFAGCAISGVLLSKKCKANVNQHVNGNCWRYHFDKVDLALTVCVSIEAACANGFYQGCV